MWELRCQPRATAWLRSLRSHRVLRYGLGSVTYIRYFGDQQFLVPTIIAGILGGVVAAVIFPKRKAVSACLVGILLAGCILFLLFRHSLGHGRHNPWLWYWPIWLVPTYAIGGFLGRRYWNTV